MEKIRGKIVIQLLGIKNFFVESNTLYSGCFNKYINMG